MLCARWPGQLAGQDDDDDDDDDNDDDEEEEEEEEYKGIQGGTNSNRP